MPAQDRAPARRWLGGGFRTLPASPLRRRILTAGARSFVGARPPRGSGGSAQGGLSAAAAWCCRPVPGGSTGPEATGSGYCRFCFKDRPARRSWTPSVRDRCPSGHLSPFGHLPHPPQVPRTHCRAATRLGPPGDQPCCSRAWPHLCTASPYCAPLLVSAGRAAALPVLTRVAFFAPGTARRVRSRRGSRFPCVPGPGPPDARWAARLADSGQSRLRGNRLTCNDRPGADF